MCFRIYFVTWNVATKYPEQDLHELLDISHTNETRTSPDLYFIGYVQFMQICTSVLK